MQNSIVAGADIGGSHITVALVDLKSRTVIKDSFVREHVNAHGQVNEILTSWSNAIKKVFSNDRLLNKKIGIAMPNPVDYEKGICYIKGIDKYDALYGLNLKELLAEHLNCATVDIRMKNDAACFLQGEVFEGSAKGCEDAIGLTIGTGIGTAYYHNGVAQDADLWHTPFKSSILEDYISSRWFVKRYLECSGKQVQNVKELAAKYSTDENARDVFKEFASNLTLLIRSFAKREKPEVVVIGGNIVNASELFFPDVERLLASQSINIRIQKAQLGEEAAILGAASCWYEKK
jgi:glucokinase